MGLMRSTMYSVPDNPDMKKQTGVPLGLVMSPLAEAAPGEYPPPVVNLGELGPVTWPWPVRLSMTTSLLTRTVCISRQLCCTPQSLARGGLESATWPSPHVTTWGSYTGIATSTPWSTSLPSRTSAG